MSKRDYYEVLKVSKTATAVEIKKSYRKIAMENHPDRNPDNPTAETIFKEASEAYSVLSDDAKRGQYDQYGHAAFDNGAGGFDFNNFQGFEGFDDVFGDIFSNFFSGGAGGSRGGNPGAAAGTDLRYDLKITFEEAAFGAEKEVTVMRRRECEVCDGTGAGEGSTPETCSDCGGAGQVRMQQGFFAISRPCPSCQGKGQIIKNPCAKCRGVGLTPVSNKLNVKIPAGIDNGQRLKLRGEGESGVRGGRPGDLYVVVAIEPHKYFERIESDVVFSQNITYSTAVLGGEVEVPTLDGQVNLKIPAGTQSGKTFRMRNKGIQILGANRRGDQHVRIRVVIPKKVSTEHQKLIEELKIIEDQDIDVSYNAAHAEDDSFFDKFRNIFN